MATTFNSFSKIAFNKDKAASSASGAYLNMLKSATIFSSNENILYAVSDSIYVNKGASSTETFICGERFLNNLVTVCFENDSMLTAKLTVGSIIHSECFSGTVTNVFIVGDYICVDIIAKSSFEVFTVVPSKQRLPFVILPVGKFTPIAEGLSVSSVMERYEKATFGYHGITYNKTAVNKISFAKTKIRAKDIIGGLTNSNILFINLDYDLDASNELTRTTTSFDTGEEQGVDPLYKSYFETFDNKTIETTDDKLFTQRFMVESECNIMKDSDFGVAKSIYFLVQTENGLTFTNGIATVELSFNIL